MATGRRQRETVCFDVRQSLPGHGMPSGEADCEGIGGMATSAGILCRHLGPERKDASGNGAWAISD